MKRLNESNRQADRGGRSRSQRGRSNQQAGRDGRSRSQRGRNHQQEDRQVDVSSHQRGERPPNGNQLTRGKPARRDAAPHVEGEMGQKARLRRLMRRAHLAKILKSGQADPELAWKLWRKAATVEELKKWGDRKTLLPPMPPELEEDVKKVESEPVSDIQPEHQVATSSRGGHHSPILPPRADPSSPVTGPSSVADPVPTTVPIPKPFTPSDYPSPNPYFYTPMTPGRPCFPRPVTEPLLLLRPIAPAPLTPRPISRYFVPILHPVPARGVWRRLGPPVNIPTTRETPEPTQNLESTPTVEVIQPAEHLDQAEGLEPVVSQMSSPGQDKPEISEQELEPVVSHMSSPGQDKPETTEQEVTPISDSRETNKSPTDPVQLPAVPEGWQDEAAALPGPLPFPENAIPEPMIDQRREAARREVLVRQLRRRKKKKKSKKNRGPRQLQPDDYESNPNSPKEPDSGNEEVPIFDDRVPEGPENEDLLVLDDDEGFDEDVPDE
ncbi:proteoglycan 4-like [Cotesia glomerata]|uniref:proteoglycan 4-like n=1 Tax=Cotesia glomerata TaxID=32391 RepID=UPI001D03481B|nr:proteoglycan 4-like [Cotesia glomerata]